MINYCFQSEPVIFKLESLAYTKSLPANVKSSKKYMQIKSSLTELGLIEPVIIFIDTKKNQANIIDGHLRVEALKELKKDKVKCLISTVFDTYTPNNKVNRTTIIQEQKMIKKALNAGVSVEKLSSVLNMSVDIIKGKVTILNGIDPEVVHMLAEHHVPKSTFYVLKKMKPLRQIECASLMVNVENFTKNFALSLLSSTVPSLLNSDKASVNNSSGRRRMLDRLEKEMAQIHVETQKLRETYGVNTLKLVIIKSHIASLLNNVKILQWFIRHKPELLAELNKIANINSLEEEAEKNMLFQEAIEQRNEPADILPVTSRPSPR